MHRLQYLGVKHEDRSTVRLQRLLELLKERKVYFQFLFPFGNLLIWLLWCRVSSKLTKRDVHFSLAVLREYVGNIAMASHLGRDSFSLKEAYAHCENRSS